MARLDLRRVLPWTITAGFFVLWELVCWGFKVDRFILPTPVETVQSLIANAGAVFSNALQTLFTTLIGFALAVVVGIVLGLIIGASRIVYDGVYPIMVSFNSIPKVAIVPLLVIWFGIGAVPAIITAFALSFFPVVVNVAAGLATIEPELQDVLRVLGATKMQILLKVGLPRAMPYLFASLKVAIGLAFIDSILAETIAAGSGIGYLMMVASSRFDVPLIFAGLLVIGFMGVLMYEFFAWLERHVTFWATRSQEISV